MDITFFLLSWLLLSSQVASRSLQKSSFTSFHLIHAHSIPTSLQTTVYPGDRDILTDIIPSDEYLVFINLTIGVPHVPQLVVFDTGSRMILFEQNRSETYAKAMCDNSCKWTQCKWNLWHKVFNYAEQRWWNSGNYGKIIRLCNALLP